MRLSVRIQRATILQITTRVHPFLQRNLVPMEIWCIIVGLHFPFEINDSARESWREMNPGTFGPEHSAVWLHEYYSHILIFYVPVTSVPQLEDRKAAISSRITHAGR